MKKGIFLILMLLGGLVLYIVHAQSISVRAGYITKATLYAQASTWRWGGEIGYITEGTFSETPKPVATDAIGNGIINLINITGSNLLDKKHYLAALPQVEGAINYTYEINVLLIKNITESDLEEWGIFNASNFPVFHPNYYQHSDNPKATFCCHNETILISGKLFQPYVIQLKQNVKYYLLKYQYNETLSLPIFLVNLSTYTCYNYTSCNFEFMLPAEKTYNFYVLSKYPVYEIKVWIDGIETTSIPKTGLPYNITAIVKNPYESYAPVPNATVVIFEDNGNNIFAPLPLSSVTSRAMTTQVSDAQGRVQFIIAPTVTKSEADVYSLKIGLLWGDEITNVKTLQITDTELTGGKKHISPSELLEHSVVTTFTMRQISDSLFYWCTNKKANKYMVEVKTDGSYTIRNESDGQYYDSAIIQTGAVNYISVILKDANTGTEVQGYVKLEERQGYLVMNPTYNPPVVGNKTHIHQIFYIPTGTGFVITPTKIGPANSEVKLYVYDSNYKLVAQIPFYINEETSFGNVPTYENDALKVHAFKIVQVIDTIYYAYQ